jgi:hypothetical protein
MASDDEIRLIEKLLSVYEMTGTKLTADAKATLAAAAAEYHNLTAKGIEDAVAKVSEIHTGVADEVVEVINGKLIELRKENVRLQAMGSRPAVFKTAVIVGVAALVVSAGSFAGGYYLQRAQVVRQVQDSAIAQMKGLADDLCPADRRAQATDKK